VTSAALANRTKGWIVKAAGGVVSLKAVDAPASLKGDCCGVDGAPAPSRAMVDKALEVISAAAAALMKNPAIGKSRRPEHTRTRAMA
jgi:hypothetical protein